MVSVPSEVDSETASALTKCVRDNVATILQVAAKSKKIKGTFVRALKEAAGDLYQQRGW